MTTPDWERIQEIYHEACKLPLNQRRAFVEKKCGSNIDVAREVMDLLDCDDEWFPPPPIDLPLTSSTDDLIGRTIGERYFIEKELGHGGMGRVYLAWDRNVHDRAVVVKVLSLELLEHHYARQKFVQEAEVLSRIHHTGVVDVSGKGEWEGRPYFVMQFIDGEDLRSQISPNTGMNLEHAASIIRQIGEALEAVHERSIFHRDLKPSNIMLRRGTDKIVLVDFGIAKVPNSDVTATNTNHESGGTLPYMSPEQLRGENVTAASDIYSTAVVAYEMVTGRLPFNATTQAELLKQQRAGVELKPTVLRRDLPSKAENIILRGLAFKAQARCQNAKQFGDNLAHALTRPKTNGIPKRWLYTSLIVLGVAMLSFGAYKYWNGKLPPNRSFSYFLTVQKMHDGKSVPDPVKSHGEDEIFDNGDRFRLTVTTPVSAFLYIFHEGSPASNGWKVIFPRQPTSNGSAIVGADQSVESEWITFSDPPGTENFWLVWSTAPVRELESATSEALKDSDRALTGQTLVAVQQYLVAKKAEIDATTYNYNSNKTAVVRARRDLLVSLAQFKHR